MRVVHSGLPPCVGPWTVDDAGVWRRWCLVPAGEAPVLAAETDNPDERAACDQELGFMVLVGGAASGGNPR